MSAFTDVKELSPFDKWLSEEPWRLERYYEMVELPSGFKEYAEEVLPEYKPIVLWRTIEKAKYNGVI